MANYYSSSRSSCVSTSLQSLTMESNTSKEVKVLKDVIESKITIDPYLKRQNKEVIESFLDAILNAMKKESKLFEALFQRTYYTGSSYEGLRISDPNEFDIDVVLKLPFAKNVRTITPVKRKSGFASYRLSSDWNSLSYRNPNLQVNSEKAINETFLRTAATLLEIDRCFIEDGYIIPAKVRSWMQSIIDRIPIHCLKVKHVFQIILSHSGPAKTFKLYSKFRGVPYEISVDLVPVIIFSFEDAPGSFDKSAVNKFNIPKESNGFWFMVPKEYSGPHCRKDSVEARRLWRIHFPEFEKYIIHNRGCVKPVIKLMKRLRDKQGWHALSSYALKTVVISRVFANSSQEEWNERKMPAKLIESLKQLSQYLTQGYLPHIFFSEDSLLQSVDGDTIFNINNRLRRIITDFESDFSAGVERYF